MPGKNERFYPIIYVRGYAMTAAEIDDTTVDPFCGFNIGSTVYRAVPDKTRSPRKYIFESPVLRLVSDFDYSDIYENGYDILDPEWKANPDNVLARRSIIIFRYYDEASQLLGTGNVPSIPEIVQSLASLISRVRELVCANEASKLTPDTFRCYLVGHSMGGLICRALLQNPAADKLQVRRCVDKVFTYATPHNGIEFGGINVPAWLGRHDINNFNREVMADYLNLKKVFDRTGRVDWLPDDCFPAERFFTMVGTNRLDYEAAFGLARSFVGHGSDGLVRIENATLNEWNNRSGPAAQCAKAYAYRSHSGYFGLVNGEEAYQNLTRFLFGDVRVDMWIDIDELRLPDAVDKLAREGHEIDALYQIELLAAPRGKLWYLTRRTAEEDSVACLTHKEFTQDRIHKRSLFLSTIFLANSARVNPRRRSLAYAMHLGVRVPDYEVDQKLWTGEHYEGGYLFDESMVVELVPPRREGETWHVKYAWQSDGVSPADTEVTATELAEKSIQVVVPFSSSGAPGIRGQVRLVASAWNAGAED
ncbi:MAG: hypothetical protein JWP36_2092 [Paucimonas sp.]|nr:hypothetical protein [Paucimonas sp.]